LSEELIEIRAYISEENENEVEENENEAEENEKKVEENENEVEENEEEDNNNILDGNVQNVEWEWMGNAVETAGNVEDSFARRRPKTTDIDKNNIINMLLIKYGNLKNIAFSQTIKRVYYDSHHTPLEIDMWKLCDMSIPLESNDIEFLITPGLFRYLPNKHKCRILDCIKKDVSNKIHKDLTENIIDFCHNKCDYNICECSVCREEKSCEYDLYVKYKCKTTPVMGLNCFILNPSNLPRSNKVKKIIVPR
jgi:hypothetical protein